jgi:hypothetical protein
MVQVFKPEQPKNRREDRVYRDPQDLKIIDQGPKPAIGVPRRFRA